MATTPVDDADAGPADASQGYCIELNVAADGSMTIGVEPASVEAGEEGSGDTDQEDTQPVANLAEALRLIKDIVAHAGQIEDAVAGNTDMAAGYGKS